MPPVEHPPLRGTLTGVDVLRRRGFDSLRGRRVGLITNHTGRAIDGAPTASLLRSAGDVRLERLFSPEHGLYGAADERLGDTVDDATGLPVHSLYGEYLAPTPEHLRGLDDLVFDIQDVGCRFYTYISTLGGALEAAGRAGVRCVVLDRPNPINGMDVEGPVADADRLSFTAWHALPVRHGMTVGELAGLFRAERGIAVEMEVVPCEEWRRADWWDATGIPWVDPSPNMRSLTQAILYPGVGLLETTNVSVGRGTDRPFEVFGAPWMDGRRVWRALCEREVPGASFVPRAFVPSASRFARERCDGVEVLVTDRDRLESVSLGIEIAAALRDLHADEWRLQEYERLVANRGTLDALRRGAAAAGIAVEWRAGIADFRARRRRHLLYPPG